MDTTIFELQDGRELAYSEAGEASGTPVLAFHGTPGSRRQLLFPTSQQVAATGGIRLIAPDRPGYGHSTFQPGRRLVDWPGDVSALADHLGLDRFAVVGLSGGGPHALVCAALLPDRVTRAGVVSGIGPITAPEDTEGMMRMNQVVSSLAKRSEFAVLPVASLMSEVARRRPELGLRSMIKQLPPCDAAILERPEIREVFIEDARRAPRSAARAVAQDMALFSRPWGFELADIVVPVEFWQGTADRNVPPTHGRRQADEVKDSVLHELPDEGHFLVMDHMAEILQAVAR